MCKICCYRRKTIATIFWHHWSTRYRKVGQRWERGSCLVCVYTSTGDLYNVVVFYYSTDARNLSVKQVTTSLRMCQEKWTPTTWCQETTKNWCKQNQKDLWSFITYRRSLAACIIKLILCIFYLLVKWYLDYHIDKHLSLSSPVD